MKFETTDTEQPLDTRHELGQSGPRLRTMMTVLSVVVSGVSIGIAIVLFMLPNTIQEAGENIANAAVSVRNAEAIEDALIEHYRTRSSVSRATHAATLRQRLAQKEDATTFEDERENRLFATFAENLRAYLALAEQAHVQRGSLANSSAEIDAALEDAYESLQQYIQLNHEQTRRARQLSRTAEQRAKLIGSGGALLLLLAVGMGLIGLYSYVLRPLYRLTHTIARFRTGELSARASVEGSREFREINTRFNEMASMIERRRQEQLAFLAGVAHDLRNPLAVIRMSAQMINQSDNGLPSEERIRETFEAIERQTTLLERMVDDFLDAAAIEAGSLTLQKEACDAVELAEHACELFESASDSHQLEVHASDEELPFECDSIRIQQVLINLVSNALKYSPQGGKIEVSVEGKEDEIIYAVTDQGMGIRCDQLKRIFEPFHRANTPHKSISGAGLGLSVVKRIVEGHGGTIGVESSPGRGSTFRVRLPR